MKRYTHSAIILLAVLAFVGCTKTDEFQHNPDSALQIESVSGISPFALTTKAVITGNTLPDSEAATGIGIFVTASDGSAYDGHDKGYTNVNFANSGSGWSTVTPVYLSDTEGKLYGYFPYNSNAADLKAIPVQSSLNDTDYLYAEPQTVSHSNKNVSLTMNHALSRLHLTIKKGANFTANAPLSKITLKSTAIDATGTMDLTTGAITAAKGADETGAVELATDGTITAEGIEKDILLVPADNSEGKKGISISLMIAGKPAGITISAENGIDIRSGIQNNVTLTVEDTGIKVGGVGVGEWGEGGSQEVQVGAHTVTIKVAEDITAGDVLFVFYSEGDNVTLYALSQKGMALQCTRDDNVKVPTPGFSNGLHTFSVKDISQNVVVTLRYVTIKFDMNGRGGTSPADIIAEAGKTYSSPSPVTLPPLSALMCWCTTPECTNEYNFSNPFKEDMTLYAKWHDCINGHLCVKLAGYYWATENNTSWNINAKQNSWGAPFFDNANKNAAESWGNEGGHAWTLPSNQQWQALIDNCTWTWTTQDGKNGRRVSDKADDSKFIFLPAAGYCLYSEFGWNVSSQGGVGAYWTSNGSVLKFDSESACTTGPTGIASSAGKGFGATIRPVAN